MVKYDTIKFMCDNKHDGKKMSDSPENLFPKISRNDAIEMINQADIAFEEKKYRKTIRLLGQALNAPLSDFDKGYILYLKGKAYHEIGNTAQACHQWSLAIELGLAHPTGVDLISEEYRKHCT